MNASTLAIVASRSSLAAVAPLLEAAVAECVEVDEGRIPDPAMLVEVAGWSDGILVIGPRNRSPRTVLDGPVSRSVDGRVVPCAWLPAVGSQPLRRFALTAASVRGRPRASRRTVAVLAQRSARYRHLAGRVASHLERSGVAVHRWTADDVDREELAAGLGLGVACAAYVGHGRPNGWVGYRGVRRQHLEASEHPVAAVLSLTCLTASRRHTGLSFAEALPLQGAAAAVFASTTPTNHVENTRLVVSTAATLATGRAETIGGVVTATAANRELGYRLLGDPLAPLLDADCIDDRLAEFTASIQPPPLQEVS